MIIIDNDNLIPDKSIIYRITREHPLCKNLNRLINNLIIESSDSERIKLDYTKKDVTLYICKTTTSKDNYEYILYREFSHVADRLDPRFNLSEEEENLLNDLHKQNVIELLNVYIDARLNDKGLF